MTKEEARKQACSCAAYAIEFYIDRPPDRYDPEFKEKDFEKINEELFQIVRQLRKRSGEV